MFTSIVPVKNEQRKVERHNIYESFFFFNRLNYERFRVVRLSMPTTPASTVAEINERIQHINVIQYRSRDCR